MIKYIVHYDIPNREKKRNYVLSCVNKVSYILKTLSHLGQKVEVISASNSIVKSGLKKDTVRLYDGVQLKLLHGFGRGSFIKNKISTIFFSISFFLYLLFTVHKKDTVIVYHSLGFYKKIAFLKKIKKFKLILEVEEIYSDVSNDSKKKKKELKFFQIADAYIFPTELLDEKINTNKKPVAIIYGTYQVEKDYGNRFCDGKIHCVYAGTFDPRKGATAAVAAAQFLDEKYHIHILGFGSKNDEAMLKKQILEISKSTKCTVTFDGLKSGEEYIRFLQKCQIGLSTQMPEASFNDTSFPSKILSYMSNGLRVVSIRISAIERSAIGKHIYYYDEQTPQEIAEAISHINFSDTYDSRAVIAELDTKFVNDLNLLVG